MRYRNVDVLIRAANRQQLFMVDQIRMQQMPLQQWGVGRAVGNVLGGLRRNRHTLLAIQEEQT